MGFHWGSVWLRGKCGKIGSGLNLKDTIFLTGVYLFAIFVHLGSLKFPFCCGSKKMENILTFLDLHFGFLKEVQLSCGSKLFPLADFCSYGFFNC